MAKAKANAKPAKAPSGQRSFTARLLKGDAANAWTYVVLPFSVEEAFGARGRVYVKATVDGVAFDGSLTPWGDGRHILHFTREVREAAGVAEGDEVRVTLAPSTGPRPVETPDDLANAFAKHKAAHGAWEKLAPSHKRAYVQWIEEAKRAETRASRIEKCVAMVGEGKKLK